MSGILSMFSILFIKSILTIKIGWLNQQLQRTPIKWTSWRVGYKDCQEILWKSRKYSTACRLYVSARLNLSSYWCQINKFLFNLTLTNIFKIAQLPQLPTIILLLYITSLTYSIQPSLWNHFNHWFVGEEGNRILLE